MAATLNLLASYRTMSTMRAFEELVGNAVVTGEVHGEMHLGIGQEAIGAALAGLLRDGDAVVSTHRAHLHALAHGVDPVRLLAELLERDGLCGGKGGHMHLFAPERSFMCTGIVGAGAPIAAGYALAQRRAGGGAITLAVAGDGAMNQGAVLETLNLAALWSLPIVFLCEDNGYGISVRRDDATAGRLVDRGIPFGIEGEECDGTDVAATFNALDTAFTHVRRGNGPRVVVATCYRFRGHYEGDADTYRSSAEKEAAAAPERDPLQRLRTQLADTGADPEQLNRIDEETKELVNEWAAKARAFPFPDVAGVREDVYA